MKKHNVSYFLRIFFVFCVAVILVAPFVFAHRYIGMDDVSVEENRLLAHPTAIFKDGRLHLDFFKEYDAWFADHMGFRQSMINISAWIDYYCFNRFPDSTYNALGKNGEIVDRGMVDSYIHADLLSDDEISRIGEAYQTVNEWLEQKNIQLYVVQCVEKNVIYPESYLKGVYPIGNTYREDQIVDYLKKHTNVNCIYMKDVLEENKAKYKEFNSWGDAAHWSPRGAYVGYSEVMKQLNADGNDLRVLQEEDYDIETVDAGAVYYGKIHKNDIREEFTIKDPKAQKELHLEDLSGMIDDPRDSAWYNTSVQNDKKLLIMGDSYFYLFIVDDFAESFANTWMIMGDYMSELPNIVQEYKPDIVIIENAQRADRSHLIIDLASKL